MSPRRAMTFDEYLRFEETVEERYELVAGEVHATTGGTQRHGRIIMNIAARLWNAAAGGPCRVFASDMKVRVAEDVVYYPDVVVACTPGDDDAVSLGDPCTIVEVTSPRTRAIDRREKLVAYRRIGALRAYLIVDHRRRRVERRWRDDAGVWWREDVIAEGTVSIPCPETVLSLDEIYEGVELPAVREPEPAEYEA